MAELLIAHVWFGLKSVAKWEIANYMIKRHSDIILI